MPAVGVPAPVTASLAPAPAVRVPSAWRDWVALAKPEITGLIVLVAVGGYFVAAPAAIDVGRLATLVVLGAAASAGAAMLNHYVDRDVDARMVRTARRPLPTDRIRSPGAVLAVGLALLAVGIGGATVLLNPLAGLSILLGGVTYVGVYTVWLKRRSSLNIVIGGFAGSAPALAGGAAATGTWSPAVLALALLVFLWTPPHFWSLALLLRSDYEKAGLPMLPRMDDPAYSGKVVVVSAAVLLPATVALGLSGPIAWPTTVLLLALGLGFVAATAPLWHDPDRRWARRGFLYSGPYLLAVLVALVVNWALVARGVVPGL